MRMPSKDTAVRLPEHQISALAGAAGPGDIVGTDVVVVGPTSVVAGSIAAWPVQAAARTARVTRHPTLSARMSAMFPLKPVTTSGSGAVCGSSRMSSTSPDWIPGHSSCSGRPNADQPRDQQGIEHATAPPPLEAAAPDCRGGRQSTRPPLPCEGSGGPCTGYGIRRNRSAGSRLQGRNGNRSPRGRVLFARRKGSCTRHTAHRYRTGGDRDQGIGLRDLLAGEDKEPGANGESIPAEKKMARGREVIPGHSSCAR